MKVENITYGKTVSISAMLRKTFSVAILLVIVSILSCLMYVRQVSGQYNRLIENVTFANSLSNYARVAINEEIWNIVIGRTDFDKGDQYHIIYRLSQDLDVLRAKTLAAENYALLESAVRAKDTMLDYVDLLGEQISLNTAVSRNMNIMREINGVSALIYDVLQQYGSKEAKTALEINTTIQTVTRTIGVLIILLVLVTVCFLTVSYHILDREISIPIKQLEEMSARIAKGELKTRVALPALEELIDLSRSLNIMAERLQYLMDENIQKQKNLQKAEMKALQAQITPHFLYNTFDTIVWLAEEGLNQDVVEVTMAFTQFYRISLSSGQDWISVGHEIEHVRNYLVIQSYRYQEILTYSIEIDQAVTDSYILKLILQPLVENALYHGIKNKRDAGRITVKVLYDEEGFLLFSVMDTGVGMDRETVQSIYLSFQLPEPTEDRGYGLYNVNRRLLLYYGGEGLHIESTQGIGTIVSFRVPKREKEAGVIV